MIEFHEDNINRVAKLMKDIINQYELDFNTLKDMYDNQLNDEDDKCVILEEDIIRADVKTKL